MCLIFRAQREIFYKPKLRNNYTENNIICIGMFRVPDYSSSNKFELNFRATSMGLFFHVGSFAREGNMCHPWYAVEATDIRTDKQTYPSLKAVLRP